jgi:hypothetical protein
LANSIGNHAGAFLPGVLPAISNPSPVPLPFKFDAAAFRAGAKIRRAARANLFH